ncbi:MAG: stage IV sporulation protein A [Clostridiales bacterium]|jgi:stage IV sporulation protein A|nr:stage IV sporulation protein A [Clostridiales bacterium]
MENFDLYGDIARRTGGDIYLGVVGPVRAGKSTFITRFMNTLVVPKVENAHVRERMVDELPQSAAGKTIMTTQPKFVPNEAVPVKLSGDAEARVRLVDCVGYLADGAQGHREGGKPRLVKTPWQEAEMPFDAAAEYGTRKVIDDHATIGIVVTSDGTIGTELPRAAYVKPEERVVADLRGRGKPYVVILNTADPTAAGAAKLRASLQEKYGVPVFAVNALTMSEADINAILEGVLFEFPLSCVDFEIPQWLQTLDADHPLIADIAAAALGFAKTATKMKDYPTGAQLLTDHADLEGVTGTGIDLGAGRLSYTIAPKAHLFYKLLSEACGCAIESDFHLMSYMKELTHAKREYDRLKAALDEAEESGYGVVSPSADRMTLEEPEIVRAGGRFGVRLRASAPSLHIMRVDVEAEVNPIVGTEAQSEELVKYLLAEFETDPQGIWDTEMFGKTLQSLVGEGLTGKLHAMPQDTQKKMRKTLSRIVNEGRGGVICVLL